MVDVLTSLYLVNNGYETYSHSTWSGLLGTYGVHPFDSTTTSGANLLQMSDSQTFVAPETATYTARFSCDKIGTLSVTGFGVNKSVNHTQSDFGGDVGLTFEGIAGKTYTVSWIVQNDIGASDFANNPCGIAFRIWYDFNKSITSFSYTNETTRTAYGSGVSENPACNPSTYQDGWFVRTGAGTNVGNPGDFRELVILWNSNLIYQGTYSPNSDGYVIVNNYAYTWGTQRNSSSTYGWCNNGSCGYCGVPNGDECDQFDIVRYDYAVNPPTASITVNNSGSNQSFCPDTDFTLRWTTEYADTVSVKDPDDVEISTAANNSTGSTQSKTGTYTITATGLAAASSAVGQALFTSAGTQSWTCPDGVTSVSMVLIGGGCGGAGGYNSPNRAQGGKGGQLLYANDVGVTPGETYTVVVGTGGVVVGGGAAGQENNFVSGTASVFRNSNSLKLLSASGGQGRTSNSAAQVTGFTVGSYTSYNGGNGGFGSINDNGTGYPGEGGGTGNYNSAGAAGGTDGISSAGGTGAGTGVLGSNTGDYGAGGNGSHYTWSPGTSGVDGAVRIMWGDNRSYPSTDVADQTTSPTVYAEATDSITITGLTNPTGAFVGADATIVSGESYTLTWVASGSGLSVSINQGVGDVTGLTEKVVSPTNNTTYQLTATGTCDTVYSTFTLNVLQPGCTDPSASNYDSSADVNDGTCVYGGVETLGSLRLFDEFLRDEDGDRDTFYTAFPGDEVSDLLLYYARTGVDVWNLFDSATAKGSAGNTLVGVRRLWSSADKNHFYTTNVTESNNAAAGNYTFEGTIGYAYSADGDNRIPVYRYYSSTHTDHKYLTTTTTPAGYTYEGIAWYSPTVVSGCGDSEAVNYDDYVNQADTGCIYDIFGCDDPDADNYDSTVTVNDGSCIFSGCTDPEADNYWAKANNDDGTCIFSGCTDALANNYWPKANNDDGTCTYDPPVVNLDISQINGVDTTTQTGLSCILGQSIKLAWTATGPYLDTATLVPNVVAGLNFNGSATIFPIAGITTYTYTVTNPGGSDDDSVSIITYVPPVLTLTLDTLFIAKGGTAVLTWPYTGDATSIVWTQNKPEPDGDNLSGSATVAPLVTTTYSAYVTGPGGDSPISNITLTVYQEPSIDSFEMPTVIDYGSASFDFSYEVSYADISIRAVVYYYYTHGPDAMTYVQKETTNFTTSSSAVLGTEGSTVTGTHTQNITWDNYGPRQIQVVFEVTGSGSISETFVVGDLLVNIDETPNQINIPPRTDRTINEIVDSPNSDQLSDMLLVDDIDIPVEIKSDHPIQVDRNKSGTWEDVREI